MIDIRCLIVLVWPQSVLESMHHIRKFLSPAQILPCIAFAEAGLANNGLSATIHYYCVRILSSMCEVTVVHCKNPAVELDAKIKMRAAVTRVLHSYEARINQLCQVVSGDALPAWCRNQCAHGMALPVVKCDHCTS
jgi:hypothetical protein